MDSQSKTDTPKIFVNSLGAKMVLVPAGTFAMGSPDSDPDAKSDEKPQFRVTISQSYYLGETEVTQGQWRLVMKTEPWKELKHVREGDDYPATYVEWDDAIEFCRRLGTIEGRSYRLPTEAEWEYACRAGSTTRFNFGDDGKELQEHAWYYDPAWQPYDESRPRVVSFIPNFPSLVKQKQANAFGLYDTHGNVSEWCSDWYGKYPTSPVVDPVGPMTGSKRVYRGGCWRSSAANCRSAARFSFTPVGRNGSMVGFRLALTSSEIRM